MTRSILLRRTIDRKRGSNLHCAIARTRLERSVDNEFRFFNDLEGAPKDDSSELLKDAWILLKLTTCKTNRSFEETFVGN